MSETQSEEIKTGLLDELRKDADQFRMNLQEEAIGVLRDAMKPNRENVPAIKPDATEDPNSVSVQSVGRYCPDVRDYLYRGLAPEVRAIRNPMTDEMGTRWFRCLRYNDLAGRAQVEREFRGEFKPMYQAEEFRLYRAQIEQENRGIRDGGGERAGALIAEGAADATSGLGAGTGAPFLPLPLQNLVVFQRDKVSKIRSLATIVTSAGQSIRIPSMSRATAAFAAESATVVENAGTPADVVLQKRKFGVMLQATDEMLEDSQFNLVSLFTKNAGDAIGAGEDVAVGKTTATVTSNIYAGLGDTDLTVAITYAKMVTAYFAQLPQYRQYSTWAFADEALEYLSTLTATDGRGLFVTPGSASVVLDDTIPQMEGRLFGRPVVSLPIEDVSTGVILDFSTYYILDGGGIRIKVHVDNATDEVDYHFTQRWDGALIHGDGGRELQNVAAA